VKCDVVGCRRDAVVLVIFRHGSRSWPYCQFHGFDKRGQLRWRSNVVRNVLKSKR
jgi:hypothetical protein